MFSLEMAGVRAAIGNVSVELSSQPCLELLPVGWVNSRSTEQREADVNNSLCTLGLSQALRHNSVVLRRA